MNLDDIDKLVSEPSHILPSNMTREQRHEYTNELLTKALVKLEAMTKDEFKEMCILSRYTPKPKE